MRNHVLTSNIAHANSPSYRRGDVHFQDELKAAIESEKPEALKEWRPTIKIASGAEPIRMESEFAALAENQLWYSTSAQILSSRYARLKSAIFGR